MQEKITLKLLPEEAANEQTVISILSKSTGKSIDAISGYHIIKRSIDARSKQPWVNLTVKAIINEPFYQRSHQFINYQPLRQDAKKVIVIGAGPAGLFAALQLIEKGIQPIVLERGKDVRMRRRDLAALNKAGVVNEDSNYCFGEGGAGTYSDGKLYTRSNKRGDINRILSLFVQFGADDNILAEAHPHIGTNKLPQIITAMRETIVACGGSFLFEHRVTDFVVDKQQIVSIKTANGNSFSGEAIILATGHSARDIFELLHLRNILIEPKPFAIGVRVEHPQAIIDSIQYHTNNRGNYLPPAAYSLVQQVHGRGVFSFCMCPGGIIAPAATHAGELVVNGWSPSKRNNPFANSGIVVSVDVQDIINLIGFKEYCKKNDVNIKSPLSLMHFQQMIERNAYAAGGGNFVAPAQRLVDFCNNKLSNSLPVCSYLPGLKSTQVGSIFPLFIQKCLQDGFKAFGKKIKGYYTNEAVVVATESRTSSPVRIPRDTVSLTHPQICNLYPCGEGAGYAGGIVSAAMDGERVAKLIAEKVYA